MDVKDPVLKRTRFNAAHHQTYALDRQVLQDVEIARDGVVLASADQVQVGDKPLGNLDDVLPRRDVGLHHRRPQAALIRSRQAQAIGGVGVNRILRGVDGEGGDLCAWTGQGRQADEQRAQQDQGRRGPGAPETVHGLLLLVGSKERGQARPCRQQALAWGTQSLRPEGRRINRQSGRSAGVCGAAARVLAGKIWQSIWWQPAGRRIPPTPRRSVAARPKALTAGNRCFADSLERKANADLCPHRNLPQADGFVAQCRG